eukprot:TRINITY_DN347_c0_g1_i1.p1 TRINITY_DN347_c0_g1~~TRINITY_DN347_c0_g1_i1.p1  ORF type:complete len:567 (+),score=143.17 TRINITY_DN347_c0_g1_i1:62-1702(+)
MEGEQPLLDGEKKEEDEFEQIQNTEEGTVEEAEHVSLKEEVDESEDEPSVGVSTAPGIVLNDLKQDSPSSKRFILEESTVSSDQSPPSSRDQVGDIVDEGNAATVGSTGIYQEALEGKNQLPPLSPQKKTYDLNVIIFGESGSGKTTMCKSLFKTDFKMERGEYLEKRTKEITSYTTKLNNGLRLTLIDTVGYGDDMNNENSIVPVIGEIERRFMLYYRERATTIAKDKTDPRVHCCFYFISAHRIKKNDIVFIKRLREKVNVIPIIAKADTMTTHELFQFKKEILKELDKEGIEIFRFPTQSTEENNNTEEPSLTYPPYAVIGSLEKIAGQSGRSYPWGDAFVEQPRHCDIQRLRKDIMDGYWALKDQTDHHYAQFIQESAFSKWRKKTKAFYDKHSSTIFASAITFAVLLIVFFGLAYWFVTSQGLYLENRVAMERNRIQEELEYEQSRLVSVQQHELTKQQIQSQSEVERFKLELQAEIQTQKLAAMKEVELLRQEAMEIKRAAEQSGIEYKTWSMVWVSFSVVLSLALCVMCTTRERKRKYY